MGWRWLFSVMIPPAATDIVMFGYIPVFTKAGAEEARAVFPDGAPTYYGADHYFAYRIGLVFRPCSLWVGVHYSGNTRRFCINLIPCVTLWITRPGGDTP